MTFDENLTSLQIFSVIFKNGISPVRLQCLVTLMCIHMKIDKLCFFFHRLLAINSIGTIPLWQSQSTQCKTIISRMRALTLRTLTRMTTKVRILGSHGFKLEVETVEKNQSRNCLLSKLSRRKTRLHWNVKLGLSLKRTGIFDRKIEGQRYWLQNILFTDFKNCCALEVARFSTCLASPDIFKSLHSSEQFSVFIPCCVLFLKSGQKSKPSEKAWKFSKNRNSRLEIHEKLLIIVFSSLTLFCFQDSMDATRTSVNSNGTTPQCKSS